MTSRIKVVRRMTDYMAYKDGNTKEWEAAVTATHAVRKLMVRFPELKNETPVMERNVYGASR